MLRLLHLTLTLLIVSSCSFNTVKKGGEKSYVYDSKSNYSIDELKTMAPMIVTTLKREPRVGKLSDLFSKDQGPIKRVGIVVFETLIKNSITGVANEDRVYLSDQGKQLMTEELLSLWEQGLPMVDPAIEFVGTDKIKETKDFKAYGTDVEDYIKSDRSTFAPDDIFFLEKGKKISMRISHNPRGMRDVSFLLVPATELMGGPKWSEQNKHFINDIAKNLDLDAVIIVQSRIDWTVSKMDKNSGEHTPEELQVAIKASTLVPLSRYNKRLEKLGLLSQTPNNTLCFGTYESLLKIPVNLHQTKEEESFDTAMKDVLNPAMKTYRDLAFMTMSALTKDLEQTR